MNIYALILAGGSGTRFWPLSRNARPKQLLHLFEDATLLQKAVARMTHLIAPEHIFILTNPIQREEVIRQTPALPKKNIIAEPLRRDTAPAVAYGIGLIAAQDPEAIMIVIPSDQLIKNEDAFRSIMTDAVNIASSNDALVTIGIKPTWPCPSYGYVERGAKAEGLLTKAPLDHPCYKVVRFREKPDTATAQGFLNQGCYSWNAGMFVWSVPAVRRQLAKHAPELDDFIGQLASSPDPAQTVETLFPKLTPISIDFALMEKADNVYNFEATFDWDDVGSWISVAKYLNQEEGNSTNTQLSALNSEGNIVFTDSKGKRVALLGVNNLIVVDTGDALLVADKSQADDIKKIVATLPPELL